MSSNALACAEGRVARRRAILAARQRTGLSLVRAFFATVLAVAPGAAFAAEAWPANVKAIYDVAFNGINIGTFEFQSQAEQQSYTLTGSAQLSILLGAVTWNSHTRSFGLIATAAPKPAHFSFEFKSNLRAGSTSIGFADGDVTDVTHLPPMPSRPDAIPLREQHLKGVLDPLSAMLAIFHSQGPHPCEHRVPIFDGRERFDLVLTPKREMKLSEQTPSGQPAIAYVCRVKYVPIAGHQVDMSTKFMVANEEIEVALRPIPSAQVFIPYQIVVPMLAGAATLTSKRVEIASPGKPQIALMQ
jgi:hypothetical protein